MFQQKNESEINREGILKKNKDIVILSACIFVHTILLYLVCDFRKTLETYGDEMAYYNMARSIFYGQGLQVHGVPFQMQNLAYSYFLAPFFCISNSVLRMHAITFANSFIMSICVIPVWLICKELKLNNRDRWFVVILIMLWPDMLTAGTLMSENLYWILSLLALLFCIRSMNTYRKTDTIIAAVICYLAYFCKEVAVCLALAYVAFYMVYPCVNEIFSKKNTEDQRNIMKRIKKRYANFLQEGEWINLIVFLAAYMSCYFLFKKILFSNVSNMYSKEIDVSFFSEMYNVLYFFYGLFYYLLASVIAFTIYPVLYPAIHYKKISEEAKKVFLYALIFLLGTMVVIVLKITVREDLGKAVPRIHLRYFAPVVALLFPVLFRAISDTEADIYALRKKWKNTITFWVMFCIISFLGFKGVPSNCVNEHLGLFYAQYLENYFGNLYKNLDQAIIFYPAAIIINVVIVIAVTLFNILQYFSRTKKILPVALFISVSIVCLVNFRTGALYLHTFYQADDAAVVEMSVINSYFKNNSLGTKNVMFVCDRWDTKNAKIYDTYFDGINNFEISYETLINKLYEMGGKDIVISEIDFNEVIWGNAYHIDTIDYFILGDSIDNLDLVIGGLQIIPEISGEIFNVYKNIDSSKVLLPIRTDLAKEDKLVELYFDEEKYNASFFVQSGISYCETSHSWTDGDELQIRARVPNEIESVKIQFDLAGTYNGKQKIVVYQREHMIYDDVVSGEGEFSFILAPIRGDCSFKICLPNAVSPYDLGESEDSRKLAIALRRMVVRR